MIALNYQGRSSDAMLALVAARVPLWCGIWDSIRARLPERRGEMLQYQAAALYLLAQQYNRLGNRILEIGALNGASASFLAAAAPCAKITTLEPDPIRAHTCREALKRFGNVLVTTAYSWDVLPENTTKYDMIFIDGDHKRVARDMPWWNWVSVGGLMIFHDYTPSTARRSQSQPVVNQVDQLGALLGREPEVLLIDDELIGMAGFYRRWDDPDWEAR